nr:hypothetical protein GGHGEOLK_00156 [White spot syndrome virus]
MDRPLLLKILCVTLIVTIVTICLMAFFIHSNSSSSSGATAAATVAAAGGISSSALFGTYIGSLVQSEFFQKISIYQKNKRKRLIRKRHQKPITITTTTSVNAARQGSRARAPETGL